MKMSELIVNTKEGLNQIKEIQFGVLNTSDIAKLSVIECVNQYLYDDDKVPIPYGPIDYRLGVNQKNKICPTCNKKLEYCPGHFGYIRLNLPIFHIGFFKKIIEILRLICKNCSRILLPEEEKYNLRIKANKYKKVSSRMKLLLSEISKLCSKVKICPYCGAINGKVKHVQGVTGPTIIVHEINKKDIENIEEKDDDENYYKRRYDTAILLFSQKKIKNNISYNKEMVNDDNNLNKIFNNSNNNTITTELTSPYIYSLFSHISPEDIIFLGMDGDNSSPIDLLIKYILVPPLPIRPTVTMNLEGTNEDDLTIKLKEMIHVNKAIKSYIEEGNGNTYKLMDDLNLLQSVHSYYINSNTKGINKNIVGNKQIRSLCTRLRGKTGRFRGNLSGKRVDFTGRTVISPDPNLRIDQLGVPVYMAMMLTYPERVNEINMKRMKKLIMNGTDKHPGANFVITNNGENKIYLAYVNREKVCRELKVGDIVERHLKNEEIVLFNRQPSLHRVSIMGFHAKILPWRTMRFNVSNCTPFNADFDGDEMNIHLPQTEEAKSEVNNLMGVMNNINSPKSGELLIASTQDFLDTCFLITQKDYFLDRTHFIRYCTYFNDGIEKVEIPPPTIYKPKELWTGKQLFSVLLKPNNKYKIIINLKNKSKTYSRKYKIDEYRCPNDGFVLIKNSILLSGIIDKSTIGSGSKSGLVFALGKDFGSVEACKFLTRISKFSSRWICDYGLSLGLGDVIPRKDLVENKEKIIEKSFKESEQQIDLYNTGKIQLKPGLNAEQSLESSLIKILSDIREIVGKYLRNILPRSNTALKMAICGSKGSDINLSQMIGCVGQQTVSGNRTPNGFSNRSLPHFEPYSKYAASKGFVGHSFYDGMNAIELFFHTMGGREGLVDTAVRTSETGYMQRRLMKALEDLTVQYNNTVTISNGEIIEFLYGDDGVEPMNIDNEDKIVYLPRLWEMIKYNSKNNHFKKEDKILNPEEIKRNVENHIINAPINKFELSQIFVDEIKDFFDSKIKIIKESLNNFGYMKKNIINNICSISESELDDFFNELWKRYKKAKVNPGEAVGAVAGQSIGEPATQMTLKTFHFAGVASMNITSGIPRIKEIINYTQKISTPVIYAKLVQEDDITAAKIVKGRIEKIKLNRICKYIKEIISPEGCYIKIKLDREYINSSHLEISIQKIREALLLNKKKLNIKLKENHIIIKNENTLILYPPETDRNYLYFSLEIMMKNLPEIVINGISTVNRVVVNKKDNDEKKYMLAIEGTGLLDIMKTDGIDYKHCTSNNIGEILNTLGIEASRKSIIYELNYTFAGHSIHVDQRHLGLISDLMTFKGTVLGFQRFSMIKMKDSVFLNSSFERTTDVLFDAAINSKNENLSGVSESIITGKTAKIGTGVFQLLMDKKTFNDEIDEINDSKSKKKNGMVLENNKSEMDYNGKDFAKDKVTFNLYELIK